MLGLELVVALGVAVLACGVAAPRVRIAPPVLMLASGVVIGLVPGLRQAHLPPEVVLLLFLPALLWWESLTTSLREIRRYLRAITLTSTVLVVATAAAVAAMGHALGMAWGPAWVLGAALAPTDATAVGALARSLPRTNLTVLRAESLVNDGTALVVYGVAVAVTTGSQPLSAGRVSWLVVLSYGGGVLAGLVVQWLVMQVRGRLDDPLQESVVSLLTPFGAYLLAETVGASGVLAVVTAGLVMSQAGPRTARADARQLSQAFWTLTTYLLNGALFVLVGLQATAAVRDLTSTALARGLVLVGAVAAVLIAVRLAWVLLTPYAIRALDRRPQQRLLRIGVRGRMISGFAGFRGAVSLAAALGVPATVSPSQPFPDRDLVVFVTAGVVVVTLLVQAPLLPVVVRWAHLPADEDVTAERYLAESVATEDALAALPRVAADAGADPDVVARLRGELEERLEVLHADHAHAVRGGLAGGGSTEDDAGGGAGDPRLRQVEQYEQLRLVLLSHKRATVVALRDARRIDDIVLRRVQAQLDVEEVRLSRRLEVD